MGGLERGQTRVKPSVEERAIWAPRQHALSMEDIEIVLPVMKTRVGGDVKPEHAEKINEWLKRRAKHDKRAERALRSATAVRNLQAERALESAGQVRAALRDLSNTSAQRDFGVSLSTDDKDRQAGAEASLVNILSSDGLYNMGEYLSASTSSEASSSRLHGKHTYDFIEAKTRCRGRAAT